MAEGDTILRAARRLEVLAGETVAASAPNPRGRAAGIERLDGHRLERISSHGKNLLFDFGDLVLHSHMGMNGSWHVYPRGARWRKPRRSAWAVLAGERHEAVQFGGPTLRLLSASRASRDPQLARLGPDILAHLDELAGRGETRVLVTPVGFVADHLEILWDLDVEARERAAALEIELDRTDSMNDDPAFIRALADLVRRELDA